MDTQNDQHNQPGNNTVSSIFHSLEDVDDINETLEEARSRTVRLSADRNSKQRKAAKAYKQSQLTTSEICDSISLGKA